MSFLTILSFKKDSKWSLRLFSSSNAVTLKKDFPGIEGQFG